MLTTDPSAPALEIRGLTKRYGAHTAVDDLSFASQPGTVTGFLGPNGAGKSTTLRMLTGLARPDVGVKATAEVLDDLRKRMQAREFADAPALFAHLRRQLVAMLKPTKNTTTGPSSSASFSQGLIFFFSAICHLWPRPQGRCPRTPGIFMSRK